MSITFLESSSAINPSYESFPFYVSKFHTMMSIGTSVILSSKYDDLKQYFRNNHPLLGICCHDKINPIKFWM
jgi:hypothetical protein